MNTLFQGIYFGAPHSLRQPTEGLPDLSLLATSYYALGLVNCALQENGVSKKLSLETRLIISGSIMLISYGVCYLADSEKVTTFMMHIPVVIASFSAVYAGGSFGACTLLMVQCNSLLEFLSDTPCLKVGRIAIAHFAILVCGSPLEKIVVIGRYLLFPIVGCEKGGKIIKGSPLEVAQILYSLRP